MKQVGSRQVWSIAEVANAIFRRIEDVPSVWIEAEVTNLNRRGTQVYLSLVDHGGDQPHQVDASMNAVVFDRLAARPTDGTMVHAYGRVEMWVARSQLRFRIERMELTGDGLLLARIDDLKRRLHAEGLTLDARKRRLPLLPRVIGLVTSGEGAARHDVIANVLARFPAARILVVNSLVQGDAAPAELVRSIRFLDGHADVDVIVLARGGGALEDLMAFNDERVCRAVAASGTPIVSAVGHESDVTVCDLVADLRVSTPTKAAEAVVPDVAELAGWLDLTAERLQRGLSAVARDGAGRLSQVATRMIGGLRHRGTAATVMLDVSGARLAPALGRRAEDACRRLEAGAAALQRGVAGRMRGDQDRIERLAQLVDVLSPARTVRRGYAIVRTASGVASSVAEVDVGDRIDIELADGRVGADVVEKGNA